MMRPAAPVFVRRWQAGYLPGFWESAAAGCVAAVILGFALGIATGGGEEATRATVDGPGFSLMYPSGWTKVERSPSISGLETRGSVTLARTSGVHAAGLVIAAVPASRGVTLPRALLDRMSRAPQPTLVSLDSGTALRYGGLRLDGFKPAVTIFAMPASGATILAACYAMRREDQRQCESLVATLDVPDIRTASLVPNRGYASRVTAALRDLDERRARESGGWQGHRSVAEAAVARRMARAYGRAADRLAGQRVPEVARAAHARLVSAVRSGRAAFAGLAVAARDESRGAYDRARRDVHAADAAVALALGELRILGYGG